MDQQIHDHLEMMGRCEDIPALTAELDKAVQSIGCTQFGYRALRMPRHADGVFYRATYDEAWVRHYVDQDYGHIDPVVLASRSSLLPFTWDDACRRFATDDRQEGIFDEAGDFGIHNGITVPVQGLDGECAVLSLIPSESPREFGRYFRRHRYGLHLLALYYHSTVAIFLAPKKPDPIRLTARQRECLTWTARGKTAWEVGEILRISEETVITHLNDAARRLGVYGKHHAVVKAITHRLIAL